MLLMRNFWGLPSCGASTVIGLPSRNPREYHSVALVGEEKSNHFEISPELSP